MYIYHDAGSKKESFTLNCNFNLKRSMTEKDFIKYVQRMLHRTRHPMVPRDGYAPAEKKGKKKVKVTSGYAQSGELK